jgi:hypothetical protein
MCRDSFPVLYNRADTCHCAKRVSLPKGTSQRRSFVIRKLEYAKIDPPTPAVYSLRRFNIVAGSQIQHQHSVLTSPFPCEFQRFPSCSILALRVLGIFNIPCSSFPSTFPRLNCRVRSFRTKQCLSHRKNNLCVTDSSNNAQTALSVSAVTRIAH